MSVLFLCVVAIVVVAIMHFRFHKTDFVTEAFVQGKRIFY